MIVLATRRLVVERFQERRASAVVEPDAHELGALQGDLEEPHKSPVQLRNGAGQHLPSREHNVLGLPEMVEDLAEQGVLDTPSSPLVPPFHDT